MDPNFQSGMSAAELLQQGVGLTYDDITMLDTGLTTLSKEDISLRAELREGFYLETPVIASPMDTVVNPKLSIAIAREGGIAVLHYNHKNPDGTPNVDAQIDEIEQVKRCQNGFIENPVTVSPNMSIEEAIQTGERYKVGDAVIDTFPVTEDGSSNGRLVGLLRKQDYTRARDTHLNVYERMLPMDRLAHATVGITLDEAEQVLWDKHIPSLPIIDANGDLAYLVTRSDVDKREQFPLATLDDDGKLRVLFAVETWKDPAYERLERGFAAGADGVVVDTSQGFTEYARSMLEYVAKKFPDKLLIGGNVSTAEGARWLSRIKGLDGYRNGQASGSICTTAGAIGFGRAGAQGVYEGALAVRGRKLVTIADGGLRQPGDITKALALGAHAAMVGNLMAGTDEGPGEVITDPRTGTHVKEYRGMGSAEAGVSAARGYNSLPQGVSDSVAYRGSVHKWVPLIRDGILSGMQVANCKDLGELHEKMYSGDLRFERRSIAALMESKPHSLQGRGQ